MIFGSKSERRKKIKSEDNQATLFSSPTEKLNQKVEQVVAKPKNKSKQRPKSIFEKLEHLEKRTIEFSPQLPNPDNYQYIGKKIVKRLGYTPGTYYIENQVTHSYKHKVNGCIISGQPPVHPIPKCEATIDLLQHIAISKFVDHLPEYRQQKIKN